MMTSIVFDGSVLGAGPRTGVGGSFLSSLEAYVRIAEQPCVLLLPHDEVAAQEIGDQIPDLRVESVLPSGRIRRRRHLRHFAQRMDAVLFHSPVVALPGRLPCPAVATVHDVPWLYPELRGEPGTRWSQRLALRQAVRAADALIVPSEATRRDLLRTSRRPDLRVEVIRHGVCWPAKAAADTTPDRPFLVLGDNRPRKNLGRLRAAHAIAQSRCADLPALRFIGPGHGYVEEEEKWSILRSSRALLHVALFEGFGMPVLEAFAHGVPVLCGNRSSLPEVAGDAALTVDPHDVHEIAEAMIQVHRDAGLRATLRERGRLRAREMTPAHSAAGWLRLHRDLIAKRRGGVKSAALPPSPRSGQVHGRVEQQAGHHHSDQEHHEAL